MLLKHNLTVASDVMSACSSDEYSTPVEKDQDEKTTKEDAAQQEDTPCKSIDVNQSGLRGKRFNAFTNIGIN